VVHRDGAIRAGVSDRCPCPFDIDRIAVEPVNQKAFAGAKGRRQPAVTATQVHDQTATDPSCLKDFTRRVRRILGGVCSEGDHQHNHRRPANGNSKNTERPHHAFLFRV